MSCDAAVGELPVANFRLPGSCLHPHAAQPCGRAEEGLGASQPATAAAPAWCTLQHRGRIRARWLQCQIPLLVSLSNSSSSHIGVNRLKLWF